VYKRQEEGRLAGLSAAEALGYLSVEVAEARKIEVRERLAALRIGSFGDERAIAKRELLRARGKK